jgi:hypothetical protein
MTAPRATPTRRAPLARASGPPAPDLRAVRLSRRDTGERPLRPTPRRCPAVSGTTAWPCSILNGPRHERNDEQHDDDRVYARGPMWVEVVEPLRRSWVPVLVAQLGEPDAATHSRTFGGLDREGSHFTKPRTRGTHRTGPAAASCRSGPSASTLYLWRQPLGGVSIRTGKGGMSAGRGPGQGEVRKMAGYAPTCSTCGAVLSGYGRSEELNFQVHFCPQCRAREEAARTRVEKQAVQTEVIPKAA